MTFGEDWGWGCDTETATKIIDAYTDQGGNFIDTANIYTKGHSETIIGDHIGRYPAKRDRLVIATKFLGNLYLGDPNGGGAHRKNIIASCEQSLRRLQTDYIDLYWMHFWDRFTPIDETLRTLDDLVRTGKVRYIGFSDTPAWKIAQAQTIAHFRGWSPLIGLQIEYSLAQRTVESDLIPMAQELGLGVTPWSPLKNGILTGKYTRENVNNVQPGRGEWVTQSLSEKTFQILDTLSDVATESNTTPAAVALAWVRQRSGVTSTIIGARTLDQLQANLESLDVILSDPQIAKLDDVTQPILSFPHEFLPLAETITAGGTHINNQPNTPWSNAPAGDGDRY